MAEKPSIVSVQDLETNQAKWVSLKKILWKDHTGKQRVWEAAERRTRGSSGIDAVAILAIIRSRRDAFPLSTVIIEQYRPPIDKFIIELPAGLVDEGETAEQAAIRELEEETGYISKKVLDSTALLATDPGMTTANMKLITLEVIFDDKIESPAQKLEEGEAIVKRVVALKSLYRELKATGFVVDARLNHFAVGLEMAERLKDSSS
ncbi:NUDIX hydrolase domain-like protein [Vararia minispora EC-137]|uniref:NUDIX hydrolase domain-like protein n=1 Tax=Vararia minispora EC-137 TaxID=1314806 RepID=A0ACB8Q9I9_9AGAM|nr:NUDIX hydrolase domain-like protein [Vararia minispora EC-137]